jgi:hypothetical protein
MAKAVIALIVIFVVVPSILYGYHFAMKDAMSMHIRRPKPPEEDHDA